MTAYYNEIDPYAAQWLRNLIAKNLIAPGDVDERSIVDVHPDDLKAYTQCHFFAGIGGWSYAARLAGYPDDRELWTGSEPCQPYSVAGKGLGEADERYLRPHVHRLIAARRPRVYMGEQVAAAAGKDWLDRVHTDMESIRYSCWSVVVPACAVDAPHRRDRLWFVADSSSGRRESFKDARHQSILGKMAGSKEFRKQSGAICSGILPRQAFDVDNTISARLEGQRRHGDDGNQPGWIDAQQAGSVAATSGALSDTSFSRRREECSKLGRDAARDREEGVTSRHLPGRANHTSWSGSEWAVGADGKARRIEPGIRLLAHGVPARVGKLRAYGNAIVPQVAAEVIGAYMEIAA